MVKAPVEETNFSYIPGGIKGVNIDSLILSHLKELNASKFSSKNKMEKRTNKFSVSQSSYDCYRKIFFEMTEPRISDVSKLGTFTVGDIIHGIIQDAFVKNGAIVEVGCGKDYFDGKLRIQGNADIKFNNCVVEIKSVSPFAWKYVAGGFDKDHNIIKPAPKIQHVRQANIYMDALGVEEGLILYINKDNLQICPFSVFPDNIIIQSSVGRCVTVMRAIEEGRVPPKVKSEECTYCNHTDLCKKVG